MLLLQEHRDAGLGRPHRSVPRGDPVAHPNPQAVGCGRGMRGAERS